jgi:hypothetical protein
MMWLDTESGSGSKGEGVEHGVAECIEHWCEEENKTNWK